MMTRTRATQLAIQCGAQLARSQPWYRPSLRIRPAQLAGNHAVRATRSFSITNSRWEKNEPTQKADEGRQWDFESIKEISQSKPKNLLLIDVREPNELQSTGTIPTSLNIPITSHPNAFHLPAEQFRHLFGFEKPATDGPDAPELVVFCKAGVRARAAAELARSAGYNKVGDYAGSWLDWSAKGGKVEPFEGGDA
ncbi:Uncharacterized protein SAPIO_CDS7004 [Scedosporium apiospermum]|uniref:Rhodanese domain-containing protein n=1 Tax=Pseudallescheria apiosperma TaxID=563466 RepID=A0A084G0X2_PSEDA|nr:Uncharacterized protein SAPIO_CDS7004 [Scedosporium apiospermum]KEZ40984.1 Uncharacterized protein SAPIO_CDS7004 [Scedosporium apiospermum]